MSAEKPRRLGRGLSALIQTTAPVVVNHPETGGGSSATPPPPGLVRLALGDIVPSRHQPRVVFDESELEQLAQSIRQAGVIQPVLVRTRDEQAGTYELVAGERRWRAARLAGLDGVPAIVVSLSEHEAAEWALIENLQRKDLNPMERAHALRNLCEQFSLSHQQLAERVGLDRSSVANLIRVTELPEPVQAMIAAGELSLGHGKVLLSIPAPADRRALAWPAAAGHWSVRRLEQQGKQTPSAGESRARVASPTLVDLERRLSEHLGTRVRIVTARDGTRGRIALEFYSLDHFDGLMSKFGFAADGA